MDKIKRYTALIKDAELRTGQYIIHHGGRETDDYVLRQKKVILEATNLILAELKKKKSL